jgi:poly-beta-1,6-N-acetyl-D-glucosamine synthase
MGNKLTVSVVITAYKEPTTIGKAILAFATQRMKPLEIIVCAPDDETLTVAKKLQKKYSFVRVVQDNGNGKPSALNLLRKKIRGELVILSDGDVYTDEHSISRLITHFSDSSIGVVSGRVVPTNDKKTMFGYWAHLTTLAFHHRRLSLYSKKENILCSGYLYAIRRNLFPRLPQQTLADDAFVTESVNARGYWTAYEPHAYVYVKYPTNLIDWIKQKKRTAGRVYEVKQITTHTKLAALGEEILTGGRAITEVRNPVQWLWFFGLLIMRSYVWFRVFFDYRLWGRGIRKTWERVESTK